MNLSHNSTKGIALGVIASFFSAGSLLAQTTDYSTSAPSSGGSVIGGLVPLIIGVLIIVSLWKVFTKAGQPGWASIIPIYNAYIMCKIAGKPGWWVILMLIPVVNLVIAILLLVALAKSFGKGVGFALGMIFLPFIFYPILGFGDATYQGPQA